MDCICEITNKMQSIIIINKGKWLQYCTNPSVKKSLIRAERTNVAGQVYDSCVIINGNLYTLFH